jgi:hypothetical protein
MNTSARRVATFLLAGLLCSTQADDRDEGPLLSVEKGLYAGCLRLAHEKPLNQLKFPDDSADINAWRVVLDYRAEVLVISCYLKDKGADVKWWRFSKGVKDASQIYAEATGIIASGSRALSETQAQTLVASLDLSKLFDPVTKKEVMEIEGLDGLEILVEAKGHAGYTLLSRSGLLDPTTKDNPKFRTRDLHLAAAIFYLLGLTDTAIESAR